MKERTKTILTIVITLLTGLIYFYIKLPAINLKNPDFYIFFLVVIVVYCILSILMSGNFKRTQQPPHIVLKDLIEIVKKQVLIPAILCGLLLIIYLAGLLISAPLFRAKAYSEVIAIETGDFITDVEEISYDQIPMLDLESARRLGNRKLGELSDMVSQFEVSDDYSQINYQGRPVRVTSLIYGDIIKWFNNRSEGLPGYIMLDMVTQNAEFVRLDEGIKYSPSEPLLRNLNRHLRFCYPTYMFGNAVFEIDEEGTPYWVCPRIVKTIGLFGGDDINGAVLVNAITGETQYYTAEEVPSWVDRVYSATLLIKQYDWYGAYQSGFFNSMLGQQGVTETTDGYNYIAMNDDVYMYTGITSVGSDESNIGFILCNQRTKETTFYSIAGAEEYSAMDSAEGLVQDLGYRATFPLLLNISGQPTYFMALKDSSNLVKMYAMVNVQYYQNAVIGQTVAECEINYKELLLKQGLVETEEVVQTSETGIIEEIKAAVIDGNSFYYIRLEGNDYYYVISAAEEGMVVILKEGDEVDILHGGTEGELRTAYTVERK